MDSTEFDASSADIATPRRRRGTRVTIGTDGVSSTGSDSSPQQETEIESGASVSVTPRKRRSKADATSAKAAADMLIGGIETLAYARYRTRDARMTPDERAMTLEGLSKSTTVLPAEVVSQISSLSAPVMACCGFVLYFMRLGEMEQRHRANKRDDQLSAQAGPLLASQAVYPTPEGAIVETPNGFVPTKNLLQNLQEG